MRVRFGWRRRGRGTEDAREGPGGCRPRGRRRRGRCRRGVGRVGRGVEGARIGEKDASDGLSRVDTDDDQLARPELTGDGHEQRARRGVVPPKGGHGVGEITQVGRVGARGRLAAEDARMSLVDGRGAERRLAVNRAREGPRRVRRPADGDDRETRGRRRRCGRGRGRGAQAQARARARDAGAGADAASADAVAAKATTPRTPRAKVMRRIRPFPYNVVAPRPASRRRQHVGQGRERRGAFVDRRAEGQVAKRGNAEGRDGHGDRRTDDRERTARREGAARGESRREREGQNVDDRPCGRRRRRIVPRGIQEPHADPAEGEHRDEHEADRGDLPRRRGAAARRMTTMRALARASPTAAPSAPNANVTPASP